MDPMTFTFSFVLVIALIGLGLTVYFDRRSKKKR
jgi:hypothetical protein